MSTKVQMLAQISGARDGENWPAPGGYITVGDDEAVALVRAGLATTGKKNEELPPSVVNPTVPGHADEPLAYHVPEVPGERDKAEEAQKAVDESQAAAGAQRVESTTEAPKPEPESK